MNRPALIKAVCFSLHYAGEPVSRRSVQDHLKKAFGKGFSSDEIAPIVRAFKSSGPNEVQNESKPSPSRTLKNDDSGPGQVKTGSSHAHVQKDLRQRDIIGAEPQSDSPAAQAALIPEAVKPVKKPAKPRAPYVVAECPYEDFEQIPTDDISELRAVAGDFAAHFANAGPDKVPDHVGSYTTMLAKAAKMRRTVLEAWEACGKARLANGGAPLFKGMALRALDFLTYRPWNEAVPEPNSSDLLPTWPNGVPQADPNFVDERPQWMIDEMNAAR